LIGQFGKAQMSQPKETFDSQCGAAKGGASGFQHLVFRLL